MLNIVVIQFSSFLNQAVQYRRLQLWGPAKLLLAPRHIVAAPVWHLMQQVSEALESQMPVALAHAILRTLMNARQTTHHRLARR